MRAMRCFQVFAMTAALYSVASVAYAGELKFGEGPSSLETDDTGKLTDAGKKTVITEIDKIPGDDAWDLKVWAKLDRPTPGPLYVEFFQTIEGEKSIVFRHEEGGYEGEKNYTMSILLDGNNGFNKDRTYSVKVIQVNEKGKDVKMAEGKIKLINTGRKPEEVEGDETGEPDVSEQDALDSFASADEGDETPPPDGGTEAAPPETDAGKKGCSVAGTQGLAWNGLLVLMMLGGVAMRRRT